MQDIAQESLISVYQVLSAKKPIYNLKAFTRQVFQNKCLDLLRRHKRMLPLPVNEDGEVYQGIVLINRSHGYADPAAEFEQNEALSDLTVFTLNQMRTLPARQRLALLWALVQIADILPLSLKEIFTQYDPDLKTVNWPQ